MGIARNEELPDGLGASDPSWIRRWVPVVLWASVIWTFSTGWFDGDGTGSFFLPLLRKLLPFFDPETLDQIHGLLRKCAHLAEYAILAHLLARALVHPARSQLVLVFWTMFLALLWAVLDEYHQSFVPTRVGAPQDVLLDTVGAGFGLLFFGWRRFSWGRQLPV